MCHDNLKRKCASRRRCDNVAERCDEGLPVAAAASEGAMSFGRETIDAGAGSAATALLTFPGSRDLSGFFQAIQRRIERAFFEFEQTAAADFKAAENFEPVCLAAFERGEDQHFQMAAEFVAAD